MHRLSGLLLRENDLALAKEEHRDLPAVVYLVELRFFLDLVKLVVVEHVAHNLVTNVLVFGLLLHFLKKQHAFFLCLLSQVRQLSDLLHILLPEFLNNESLLRDFLLKGSVLDLLVNNLLLLALLLLEEPMVLSLLALDLELKLSLLGRCLFLLGIEEVSAFHDLSLQLVQLGLHLAFGLVLFLTLDADLLPFFSQFLHQRVHGVFLLFGLARCRLLLGALRLFCEGFAQLPDFVFVLL